jgi:hypothetical protein
MQSQASWWGADDEGDNSPGPAGWQWVCAAGRGLGIKRVTYWPDEQKGVLQGQRALRFWLEESTSSTQQLGLSITVLILQLMSDGSNCMTELRERVYEDEHLSEPSLSFSIMSPCSSLFSPVDNTQVPYCCVKLIECLRLSVCLTQAQQWCFWVPLRIDSLPLLPPDLNLDLNKLLSLTSFSYVTSLPDL